VLPQLLQELERYGRQKADECWAAMAAAMLSGLVVGTLLILVVAPVLYATLYGLKAPEQARTSGA